VPESGDRFGAARSGGGATIGLPGEDVGAKKNAGTAILLNEMPENRTIFETVGQSAGSTEAGDSYGAAVAFADGDLVIGIPGEDIVRALDVGAARILPIFYDLDCEELLGADDEPEDEWCTGNLDYGEATTLVQGRRTIPGRPVAGNRFGPTVSPISGMNGVAVGAPGRTISGHRAAGSVVVITPAPVVPQELHQNSASVPGTAEANDRFGTLPSS
jgi:hypothetical protein